MRALTILLCLFFSYNLFSQKTQNQDNYTYQIKKTTETIEIDGDLNEGVWQNTPYFSKFWYSFPVDDKEVETEFQTEVMMTYDDKYIYIAAICHGDGPFVIPSLKRENNVRRNEFFQKKFVPPKLRI